MVRLLIRIDIKKLKALKGLQKRLESSHRDTALSHKMELYLMESKKEVQRRLQLMQNKTT